MGSFFWLCGAELRVDPGADLKQKLTRFDRGVPSSLSLARRLRANVNVTGFPVPIR